ncbi:hypothetical protein K3162_04180 [Qipengyuania xiapuensis]|uniref:Short chain dehydrogenase-like proteobacteria domain-containing protein n=1 Tax=Qipengyuania xiapuensis TaxID=2867236 RepID=A0ABX8ZW51_9SPHN|nr:hypothetical protein [Qipengyuania xiapuensis]QZD93233.1 hypothetical protein K3162_04180 [Qipengyuania xiapuensis]
MKRIEVDGLPPEPLAAAGLFHQNWLDPIERALGEGQDVLVTLEAADHMHEEWRKAAAAMLARKHAPRRVNLVAGSGPSLDATADYLAQAPGVTGQYFRAAT